MRLRLMLAALAVLTLAGCSAMDCGSTASNGRATGACGADIRF